MGGRGSCRADVFVRARLGGSLALPSDVIPWNEIVWHYSNFMSLVGAFGIITAFELEFHQPRLQLLAQPPGDVSVFAGVFRDARRRHLVHAKLILAFADQ